MARVFTDGAEGGHEYFWDSFSSSSHTVVSAVKRSGTYSYRFETGTSFNALGTRLVPAAAEGFLRVPFRLSALPSGSNIAYIVRWMFGASTELGSVRIDSGGQLKLYTGTATQVASGSLVIDAGNFYCLEVHVKIANSGGVIETKIDGIADASFTGDTQPGADTTYDRFRYGAANIGTSGNYIYLDDLAYNDTSGGNDNSWCGDGRVVALIPSAAGDVTQLTPLSGSNWDNVNELPDDQDTTYNYDAGGGEYDLYNCADSSLPAGATILRVQVCAVAREDAAAGDSIQIGLKTNSNEYWSSNIPVITTYDMYVGTDHRVNPQTTAAWTTGQLDSLQIGVKVV